jgi:hypothetical protein
MSTVDFCNKGVTRQVPFVRFTGVILKRRAFQLSVAGSEFSDPAADEVNDLQAIAFGQAGFCPEIASDDASV